MPGATSASSSRPPTAFPCDSLTRTDPVGTGRRASLRPHLLRPLARSYLGEVTSIPHETRVAAKADELDSMAEPPVDRQLGIQPHNFARSQTGPLGEPEPKPQEGAWRQLLGQQK